MLPTAFIQRLISQDYIDSEVLLKALAEPSPVSVRLNSGKWNRKPVNSQPVPWCESGFYLQSRPSYTMDPLFHSGCYYPQEASSMFLEQAVRQSVQSPERLRVLDLCGAPGGKSTHLSDLIGSKGLLVANEVIRQRSEVLAETLTKWGSGNTLVTQNDPAQFGRLPGFFDLILVDAPCSGEGMFRSEVAVNEWSLENTLHCAERQKRIIMDVWPALKEDGILIYSTCTFNPGENEENIKWLTAKHQAVCLRIDIAPFSGISEIDFHGIYGYGFYPGKTEGEGFFISVLRKTGNQTVAAVKGHQKAELKPGKTDIEVARNWTDFSPERLLKWGNELYAVAGGIEEYIHVFQNLKVVKTGTKLFVLKKNDYLPTHELALSVNLKKDVFPSVELGLNDSVSYLRRDNFELPGIPKGWNILTYEGVNLGFVNNIGNRFNNYFPVELRIRMNSPASGVNSIIKWQ
jgi:16S rRNA C967 or C1407 C5-methylase (RsmB/RsmF family)/NOL1/NOP2/fmu family ribosome biogenesis protein